MSKNNEEYGCLVVIFLSIMFIIAGFGNIKVASVFAILLTLASIAFIL